MIGQGDNPLGVVPAIPVDNTINDEPYESPSLIGDIAYLLLGAGQWPNSVIH